MEIVSLIMQQLHAGVISLLPFAPIWLILLNLVTYTGLCQDHIQASIMAKRFGLLYMLYIKFNVSYYNHGTIYIV